LKNGFKQCKYYPFFYVKHFGEEVFIVVLYVEELIITGSQLASIQELKDNLKNDFEMKNLGLLHYFMGLQI